jgi:hypothetical protein
MKKLIGVILGSLMVFAFALNTTVQAAEYDITVCTDETTAGDLAMVESFVENAAEGAQVSRSLRRVAMAAVGELGLALKARVDSYGSLTLDDGGVIALAEGDLVAVGEGCPDLEVYQGLPKRGLKIVFKSFRNPNGRVSCRPARIQWWRYDPGGVGSTGTYCLDIPPTTKGGPGSCIPK